MEEGGGGGRKDEEKHQLTDRKGNTAVTHSGDKSTVESCYSPAADGSQTQPIPFLRAKASGSMFTVSIWSNSIPDDSSVRKVEHTHYNHTVKLSYPSVYGQMDH